MYIFFYLVNRGRRLRTTRSKAQLTKCLTESRCIRWAKLLSDITPERCPGCKWERTTSCFCVPLIPWWMMFSPVPFFQAFMLCKSVNDNADLNETISLSWHLNKSNSHSLQSASLWEENMSACCRNTANSVSHRSYLLSLWLIKFNWNMTNWSLKEMRPCVLVSPAHLPGRQSLTSEVPCWIQHVFFKVH